MQEKDKKILSTTVAIIICILFALMLFGITGVYIPGVIVFSLSLIVLRSLPIKKWTGIDWSFTIFTVYIIISASYSICRMPAYDFSRVLLLVYGAYLLMRSLFSRYQISTNVIINGYGIIFCCATVIAIITFTMNAAGADNIGFKDLYSIRYLYRPLGFTNNSWGEITLIIIGFTFLLQKYNGIVIYIATVSALLTFSRGTYISLIIFVLSQLLFLRPLIKFRSSFCGIILAIITIGSIYPSETITTILMIKTDSQRNSLEWRENATEESIKLVSERPIFGFGIGTYSLTTDQARIKNHIDTYTNSAPNILTKILVEQGFIGILFSLIIVISIIIYIIRNRYKTHVIITGGIFLSILAKEMSQATLFQSLPTIFTCVSLLAYLQVNCDLIRAVNVQERWWKGRIIGFLLLITSIISIFIPQKAIRDNDSSKIAKAVSLLKSGDNEGALKNLENTSKTIRKIDLNINKLLAYLYVQNRQYDHVNYLLSDLHISDGITLWLKGITEYNYGHKEKACHTLAKALYLSPALINTKDFDSLKSNDSQYTLLIREIFEQKIKPVTPIEKARYGYVLHYYGRKDQAKKILREAISDYPTLSKPYLLLGDTTMYHFLCNGPISLNSGKQKSISLSYINEDKFDLLKVILDNYNLPLQDWYLIDTYEL